MTIPSGVGQTGAAELVNDPGLVGHVVPSTSAAAAVAVAAADPLVTVTGYGGGRTSLQAARLYGAYFKDFRSSPPGYI